MCPMKHAILAILLSTAITATGAEPPPGAVHSGKVKLAIPKKTNDKRAGDAETAPFSIFVPDGVPVIRGVVFNPFYAKTVEQKHWRTAAAHWNFALMGANLFGVRSGDVG